MKPCLGPALLALAVSAHAENIECPDVYPAQQVVLKETPPGHKGTGIVRGAPLTSAYIYTGKLHSNPQGFDAMQLVPQRVKGGWDSEHFFRAEDTHWLVCVYGGDKYSVAQPRTLGILEWWEPIDPQFKQCELQFREIKHRYQAPSDWSATAVCK